MSLIGTIAEIVEVLNEVKALKVALGFSENASIADIVTQVKGATVALATATGAAPAA